MSFLSGLRPVAKKSSWVNSGLGSAISPAYSTVSDAVTFVVSSPVGLYAKLLKGKSGDLTADENKVLVDIVWGEETPPELLG